MVNRRGSKAKSATQQAVEMAFAVPQVIMRRLTRMALAGSKPSARDRKEFQRMGAEKIAAFVESWGKMSAQAARNSRTLTSALLKSMVSPNPKSQSNAARQISKATVDIVEKGLAPVHRRVVANEKRLSRAKKR